MYALGTAENHTSVDIFPKLLFNLSFFISGDSLLGCAAQFGLPRPVVKVLLEQGWRLGMVHMQGVVVVACRSGRFKTDRAPDAE